MTVLVRLLGRPRLELSDGQPPQSTGNPPSPERDEPPTQPRGRKSWAVLARVALAERPLWRRELADELFAEADDPPAALRWCLADLRRSTGLPDLLRGDPLAVRRDEIALDVWALEDGAVPAEELGPPLLDGLDLRDSPGFDTWLLMARARCSARSQEELRGHALRRLTSGDLDGALRAGELGARLDPLDEAAQELFLRILVAAGKTGMAAAHLAACEGTFARAGLVASAGLRAAAEHRPSQAPAGMRAGVVAASLLRAGTAALDAGAADGGVETLRRAAEDAARAGDPALEAEVLRALGSALVHAVRGFDGEGAVVLHRALLAARAAHRPALAADILRELAFIDVQAGRHTSASRALVAAAVEGAGVDDHTLAAAIRALQGMNEADRGHHTRATALLRQSAHEARTIGRSRQEAWSLGVMARSLLLAGQVDEALAAAEASLRGARRDRWYAFQPFPQALRAESLMILGRRTEALADAEESFALACELGDPCWEGLSGRVLSMLAAADGDLDAAWERCLDAQRRSDRVSDRYVWVSAYVALAQLELAPRIDPALVAPLAARLHRDAIGADLPEFLAWALAYQAESGDPGAAELAHSAAHGVDNPALHARLRSLG